MNAPDNPLIIQSDKTLLLDVHAPLAGEARAAIAPFTELEKSPEHIHTYKITPLTLWNASAAGFTPLQVEQVLQMYSRYELPPNIIEAFAGTMARFGKIKMLSAGALPEQADGMPNGSLFLQINDKPVYEEIANIKSLRKYLTDTGTGFTLKLEHRGTVKWELIKLGWPVEDEAELADGEPLEMALREQAASPAACWAVRDYQQSAVDAVFGRPDGGVKCPLGLGFGVVALPCGSGKTIVGMAAMARLKTNTLILTTNVTAVHQWIDELLEKTTLERADIAEYTGAKKAVAPVTIATYQILTWRREKDGLFPHFNLFRARPWGLIIYDEVHLLPAPVFRVTAELQAVRRLGLTATLIREDGEEDSVFCLVGPKRYDVPWKVLESKGWIAEAFCTEIRLSMPDDLKIAYASAPQREKYRIASENPEKMSIVLDLVTNHPDDHIIVIGQYLEQLQIIAGELDAPLVTGKTTNKRREAVYNEFRQGKVRVIVVSKVANFAIDLPDASMAIQVSGAFGSRQEEAQRLGRILRPKDRASFFYSIVSRYTVEEEFAANRQKFLTEQGYKYVIKNWQD
ncbi:MAG: DEAD/DEAH box helicase [Spirochaetaceae bacterium]|jgi:DNA excision repair protein ERCC-3|nr:DEAD/DEAH box helicase [Spirochaetaceae bacterium]